MFSISTSPLILMWIYTHAFYTNKTFVLENSTHRLFINIYKLIKTSSSCSSRFICMITLISIQALLIIMNQDVIASFEENLIQIVHF